MQIWFNVKDFVEITLMCDGLEKSPRFIKK